MKKGGLFIVPTPIGNLEDITIRSLKTLAKADVIACEDTRVTGMLLKHFNIVPKQLLSYHAHNESSVTQRIIDEILVNNKEIALVTDAGTPGISDPGCTIIQRCLQEKLTITVLPGANALVPAVVLSGFANEPFTFFGFPPHKKGRHQFIQRIVNHEFSSILYESPNRLIDFLSELSESGISERKIFIIREISKMYEEFYHGNVAELLTKFRSNGEPKGEIVIVVSGVNYKTFTP